MMPALHVETKTCDAPGEAHNPVEHRQTNTDKMLRNLHIDLALLGAATSKGGEGDCVAVSDCLIDEMKS